MNLFRSNFLRKKVVSGIAVCLAAAGLSFSGAAMADDGPLIQLGVPTWPGVTVQSEVAARLLETMGFETKQTSSSPAFIVSSLRSGQLDIYLGGWMPTEAGLIKPPAKKGEVKIMTTNISNALMGLAVPKYVWDAGVHSVADLNKFADKFDHKIYAIEPGSGFNVAIKTAIKNDRHDLGDWDMIPSSTSAMLVQADRAIENQEWIVFLGWEPHWMNVTYDIKYLKPVGEPTIAGTSSDVLTVANPAMVKKYPEIAQFLKQFQISKDTMSSWILAYGYKQKDPEDVAENWIADNPKKVAKWLAGVKTRSDEPAMKAVKAEF